MINFEVKNHFGIITLKNLPGNKLDVPDFLDLRELVKFVESNKLKALIIKGAGRHFSSGADVENLKKLVKDNSLGTRLDEGKRILNYIYDLNIPVIAAIEGACFGGGLEIALAAHVRVISEKALLAFPESSINLMPGLGGSYIIKRFASLGQSIDIMLTGDTINSDKAMKMGLADFCVPAKTAYDYALDMAERITKDKPLKVINNIMQALKNSYVMSRDEALEEETRLFCELAKTM